MITQLAVYQIIFILKKHYKLIATYLSKKQLLHANQQINVTGNLDRAESTESTEVFFLLDQARETILDFSQETVRVL